MTSQTCGDGFSLTETVGILGVIAILGLVITPTILKAIEDAKAESIVDQKNTQTSAVAKFKDDTGHWSRHTPAQEQLRDRELMVNSQNGENPIPGREQQLRSLSSGAKSPKT